MKPLFFLLLMMIRFGVAQTPVFTDFVTGTAQVKDGQVMFYLQNVSSCALEEIQVRVATSDAFNAVDAATFITKLQPNAQDTFVMRLTQPISKGWAWTIDAVMLVQPENPTCPKIGLVAFEKVDFAGAAQAVAAPTSTPQAEITRAVTREYTVVAGDSWWKIAQRFGSTPDVIASMNGRDTNTLTVGEIIKVPAPALETATAASNDVSNGNSVASGGAPTTEGAQTLSPYTVKAGDTLFGIASKFETTVELIRQANCLSAEDVLSVNQSLQIPSKDAVLTNTCN
jgi:LysM repeat protein